MAPSPHKTAPRHFEQTWDGTDAAFLDAAFLPIAKAPRAWDRKPETKTNGDGKQKKIWRRYPTRSRTAATAPNDDDEVHDARIRAVKKLQHMSPKAMEKSVAVPHGKKRAFRATRWDRRKSLLPRKKSAARDLSVEAPEDTRDSSDEAQDATDVDESQSFSALDMTTMEDAMSVSTAIPRQENRRTTFTFSVGEPPQDNPHAHAIVASPSSCHASPSTSHATVGEDATIVHSFYSQDTTSPLVRRERLVEEVDYPELPPSPEGEVESAAIPTTEQEESMGMRLNAPAQDASTEPSLLDQEIQAPVSLLPRPSPIHHEEHLPLGKEEQNTSVTLEEGAHVVYPTLPAQESTIESAETEDTEGAHDELGSSEVEERQTDEDGDIEPESEEETLDEDFAEESIQLSIQRDMDIELQTQQEVTSEFPEEQESAAESMVVPAGAMLVELASPSRHETEGSDRHATVESAALEAVKNAADDIAAGLSLGPSLVQVSSRSSSREPTPRKLRSPSPPPAESGPDETTMTIALDEDTALLKDFLSRAAANKAMKAATISRRESLQNRRDSDVVRHALASPRKILEDKDPNSPSKYDNDVTLDLSQTLTLTMDQQNSLSPTGNREDADGVEDAKTADNSRRSSRTRKSRLPAPPSAQTLGPSKISVRRADGGEPIILKKTDAQQLSILTRANTRKNKQGAFTVSIRLLKLANEAVGRAKDGNAVDSTDRVVQVPGKKYVRWDEQLAYYQEGTDTIANQVADAESLATPDELGVAAPTSTPVSRHKSKRSKDKISTPKVRRVRGLGTANGTPGKGLLLPGSFLPEEVQEEKESAQAHTQRLPRPKSSKTKRISVTGPSLDCVATLAPTEAKLPALDVAPVSNEPAIDVKTATKERKSRLATPRKVKLPQPSSAVPLDGKENQQRSVITASTPKKGIPLPAVIIPPSLGVETGLPRRRARKL